MFLDFRLLFLENNGQFRMGATQGYFIAGIFPHPEDVYFDAVDLTRGPLAIYKSTRFRSNNQQRTDFVLLIEIPAP